MMHTETMKLIVRTGLLLREGLSACPRDVVNTILCTYYRVLRSYVLDISGIVYRNWRRPQSHVPEPFQSPCFDPERITDMIRTPFGYLIAHDRKSIITIGLPASPKTKLIKLSGVTNVACGVKHYLAIANGLVFAWGSNIFGQLGISETVMKISHPERVDVICGNNSKTHESGTILKAHESGLGFSTCREPLSDRADYYIPESGSHEENRAIRDSRDHIIQISGGHVHSSCVTRGGDLYVWGSNLQGQLGFAKDALTRKPTKHMFPRGEMVVSAHCNLDSTYVLTRSRLLYWCADGKSDCDIPIGTSINDSTRIFTSCRSDLYAQFSTGLYSKRIGPGRWNWTRIHLTTNELSEIMSFTHERSCVIIELRNALLIGHPTTSELHVDLQRVAII